MMNELLEGIAARTDGRFSVAVSGAAACGKSCFVRGFARSCSSGSALIGEEENTRAEAALASGASALAFSALEVKYGDALGEELEKYSCAVVVTSDGSFGAPRSACISAEEGAVRQMRESGKPFVIVVNSINPSSPECEALRSALEEKYCAAAYAVNCEEATDYSEVLEGLFFSFPVCGLDIDLPDWMCVLPPESKIISDILARVREVSPKIRSMRDCTLLENAFSEGDVYCESGETDPASGRAHYTLAAKEGLFYNVLSEECGVEITDDLRLMAYVRSMKQSKCFYDKFKNAIECAEENGYGVVFPSDSDIVLQPPELVQRGARCGIKLKGNASSYHIMKIDVHSEVSPVSGDAARGDEIAKGIMSSYEKDPESLWNTDMFGKTFKDMVRDGLNAKLGNMPEEARGKMRKAVTRIVNESKGGVICILL